MTDTITDQAPPADAVTDGTAPDGAAPEAPAADADALARVLDARRRLALRLAFSMFGEVPADMREEFGITADASPAEGGLTDDGKAFADLIGELLDEGVLNALKSSDRSGASFRAPRPPRKGADPRRPVGSEIADALGLRGPRRAALRAAAATFAAGFGDAADDQGDEDQGADPTAVGDLHRGSDGVKLTTITLGREPFVLLRYGRVEGHDDQVTMLCGGDVRLAATAKPGELTAETMLEQASALLERGATADEVDEFGKCPCGGLCMSDRGVSPEGLAEEIARIVEEATGYSVKVVEVQTGSPAGQGDGDQGDAAAPAGDTSGASTGGATAAPDDGEVPSAVPAAGGAGSAPDAPAADSSRGGSN